MVREIILAGRKPGCSQRAASKSSGRWEGGCEGPPSDSSEYWRARQHPGRVPESRLTDSRDILITLPINNEAFQHFSRPSHSPCNLCRPCRGTALPSLILWPGRRVGAERPPQNPSLLGWCYSSTWALSPHAEYLIFTFLQCSGKEITPRSLN